MAYDPNNIFAKILRGELPCHKIYEDADTLAFLDIMPRTEGHALVITKTEARDLFDASPEAIANVMAAVRKLAPKIKEAVGADGMLIQQFNGAAAGQTVYHLHVHILPIKEGVPLKRHAGEMADPGRSSPPPPRRSGRNWKPSASRAGLSAPGSSRGRAWSQNAAVPASGAGSSSASAWSPSARRRDHRARILGIDVVVRTGTIGTARTDGRIGLDVFEAECRIAVLLLDQRP